MRGRADRLHVILRILSATGFFQPIAVLIAIIMKRPEGDGNVKEAEAVRAFALALPCVQLLGLSRTQRCCYVSILRACCWYWSQTFPTWLKLHVTFQLTGVLLAWIAFIMALADAKGEHVGTLCVKPCSALNVRAIV